MAEPLLSLLVMVLLSGTSLVPIIELAGVQVISGAVEHSSSRGSSHQGTLNDLSPRKHMSKILGKPGHRRLHSEGTIEKLIGDKAGAYLYAMLMSQYNVNILPVNNSKTSVGVRLLLKLTQIVDVDEKNQIMTTNVWLRHEWHDHNLRWDPTMYGGIETLYIPCEEIWVPDTILYNNADGDYQITIQTKAEVRYDGLVVWEPPAIYKSFCAIDVEFFPYDAQLCEMKFGPWTYDVSKVDYFLMNSEGNVSNHDEMAVDMAGFYESVEWDVLKIAGLKRVFQYPCCEDRYVDITYHFNIRRKTLFYTINLIIPCVMISFLTVLVFYLPCQSGEKVALSISTLLSLTWFILLLSEIIPPTSLVLPLVCKYLLFTMILVTLSIAVTVLILYNHFRHPYAYAMPYWVRYVFLEVLPKLMLFQTMFSDQDLCNADDGFNANETAKSKNKAKSNRASRNSIIYNQLLRTEINEDEACLFFENIRNNREECSSSSSTPSPRSGRFPFNRRNAPNSKDFIRMRYGALLSCHEEGEFIIKEALPAIDEYMVMPEVQDAFRSIHYISGRYRTGTIDAKMKGDWEAVSRVLDRFFLIIFSVASTLGTLAILLTAPSLYDPTPAMGASDPHEILPQEGGANEDSYL